MTDPAPILPCPSKEAFETWLAEQHEQSSGVWLKLAKKGAPPGSLTYDEALDLALCYGWIDGQKAPLDATFWLQRFTPRRAASRWSKINVARAERLLQAGKLHPAGQRQVALARADGRWQAAYDGQHSAEIPPDLQASLDANPEAMAMFGRLSGANRYAILYRVQDAKKPETRAARIAKFVTMLERGETLHPQSSPRR